MKKVYSVFLLCFFLTNLFAQKETFDIINYTPPTGTKKEVTENSVSYTFVNKNNNTWCLIGIIKSTISKGSIDSDFESEWQELIVKNYKPNDTPKLNEMQEAEGWKIKSGAAKFTYNNGDAMAMLTTMSGFNRCASIVAITNSQEYFINIDSLLLSVNLNKPEITGQPQGDVADTKSIVGSWGATASENSSYRMNNGVVNYIRRQYTFYTNGTYSFASKAFDPLMDKILLGKENGTYEMSGGSIIVTPLKSVLEAWSKKNGEDDWGKLLNVQKIPLEKTSYQFTKHYFSGTHIWALVLQADKATKRDGPFNGNTIFPNAWYYDPISNNNRIIELPGGKN